MGIVSTAETAGTAGTATVSRRAFAIGFTALGLMRGQAQSTARPNVAVIDRERMIALGDAALARKPVGIVSLPAARTPGGPHDYFSDETFLQHRDALRTLCVDISALAAAYGVTHDERYAVVAASSLRAWFLSAASRMTPNLDLAQYRTKFADPKQPPAEPRKA